MRYHETMNIGSETIFHPQPDIIWLGKNREYLWANFAGQYVAVAEGRLIASGATRQEARERAAAEGYPEALVTGVRKKEFQGILIRRL
jgi:hypothetical protein